MLDPIGSRRIGRYRESERPFSCSTSSDWSPAISPASFSRSRYDTIGSSTARLLLRRTDTWLCCGPKASPESPLKSNGATGFRRTYGITVVNERRTNPLCSSSEALRTVRLLRGSSGHGSRAPIKA